MEMRASRCMESACYIAVLPLYIIIIVVIITINLKEIRGRNNGLL
jgi:hypothetical protein